MIIRGRVHDGVVVLEDDVRLAEGQPVTVVVPASPSPAAHSILDIPTVSVGAVALLFFIVFPRVQNSLPFNDVTINQHGTHSTVSPSPSP